MLKLLNRSKDAPPFLKPYKVNIHVMTIFRIDFC
ncbi:protein of unknown function [Methylorubrum extorquens]|uniref:Uncharacterized protein n=1 Tax=Methylorubrum extorquens TaxID=408 RepID=A0A2N9AYX6_METEX|nr:protein of unknown function [Methylorubrum extorquens]